jgi:hypothetical protein
LIEKAIILLGSQLVQVPPKRDNLVSTASVEKVVETEPAEPKKIDRQVKIALIILYDMIEGYGEMKIMI